ncbi:transporter [Novimethylophilus kurashikiensis]|uniref:Osmotically-inducible protein Y n=1 Tax=Novimethylophilus kurashikiensis TaxID=1825523 RepID=A0A2R5FF80_9PROT|nr:BON domain-containing protein [Novimethylophilus kurashikiensis]GBG15024.1 transporter [Novimethylophilus kurashikiensis]
MTSKIPVWLLCASLAFGLAACNKPSGNNASDGANPSSDKSTVTAKMDDAGITAKVKSALIADSDVKGLQINVDTSNGVVTLKGEAENQAQIDKAVAIAQKTDGVSNVVNQLTIKKLEGTP